MRRGLVAAALAAADLRRLAFHMIEEINKMKENLVWIGWITRIKKRS